MKSPLIYFITVLVLIIGCKKQTPPTTPPPGVDETTYTLYTSSNSGLSSNKINGITANGTIIWIATSIGLTSFDGTNWTTLDSINYPFPSQVFNCIVFDQNGVLWAGTNNGLLKYDGNLWKTYNTTNSGLPANKIRSLTVDINNVLWIGTFSGGGLARYDGAS